MRMIQKVKGISKISLILLLLIFFLLGATLSYLWTMGFYAPSEYNLPSHPNVTIEKVEFFEQNVTYFNVTVLNPSYSPLTVTIRQIKVETADGKLHNTQTPQLPVSIARGASQVFRSFWNWGNYTGQPLRVHVLSAEGLGSNLLASTPYMNFTIINVNFDPSTTVHNFTITVQNGGSSTFVNITQILVNNIGVSTLPPQALPWGLTNASDVPPVTFVLDRNWVDLQGKNVTVTVQTWQGYLASRTVTVPGPVSISIVPPVVFNATDTSHFNVTFLNAPTSPSYVDISQVKVEVFVNGTISRVVLLNSTDWIAVNSSRIIPSLIPTRLICNWNWGDYLGQAATATVTVRTVQGFETPPVSEISIP